MIVMPLCVALVLGSREVGGVVERNSTGERRLVSRSVSDESGLKGVVGDSNGNTGTTYDVTVGADVQFSGEFPGYSSMALYINGGKMNIVGGLVGRKTRLRGESSSCGYRIFDVRSGAVVHLEQLEITNGYVNFFLFIFFFLS